MSDVRIFCSYAVTSTQSCPTRSVSRPPRPPRPPAYSGPRPVDNRGEAGVSCCHSEIWRRDTHSEMSCQRLSRRPWSRGRPWGSSPWPWGRTPSPAISDTEHGRINPSQSDLVQVREHFMAMAAATSGKNCVLRTGSDSEPVRIQNRFGFRTDPINT